MSLNWTNVKSLAIPVGDTARDVKRVSIGGSVVWEKPSPLPYDAEVEYLESTGTQYINTGVTGASEWHITAQGAATPTASNCVIATTSSGGSFWGNYGNVDYWAVGNGSSWRCSLPYTSLGSFVVTFSSSSVQFTVNGETVTRSSAPNFSKAFCLFSTNGDGYGATVRVYGCKVYQNGVLVRDLIPVRKSGVGYLYDRVTGTLFGNAGTGDFVVGPDVVPVEYVENSGKQRIDTGFKADNTCKFRIDMERRGGSDYWLFGSRDGTSTATDKSCLYASVNSSIGYAMMGSAMPSFNSTLIKDGKHRIEMSLADGLVIDGDVSATYTASEQAEVFTNSYPMSIFTMYNGSSYFNAFAGRVYLFSITSGGVSRLNLLPVRVGTEGAMMDTLTRRIYRNAGTGAFTYGADLPYPIGG